MKIYPLVRQLLFLLDPEFTHYLSLSTLKCLDQLKLLQLLVKKIPEKPVTVMGLHFNNIIGLAAGVDKSADYIDCMGRYGFGHIEVGTVTPKPQPGNPKPRLFRVPSAKAIINRMGFNNKGVEHLVASISKTKYSGIIGVNIGKNAKTPLEDAINDYLFCFDKVYAVANYVTVNISSPNTPGLRSLQQGEFLDSLLSTLREHQLRLANHYDKYVPLVIKIAPDLSSEEIKFIANRFLAHKVDGVITTNTTITRNNIEGEKYAEESGGLSGKPLFPKATQVQQEFYSYLGEIIPIIASGGIMCREHAQEKLEKGAKLLQLYTGLTYRGPSLITDIANINPLSRKRERE